MLRFLLSWLLLLAAAVPLCAQDGIQRGTIKKIDRDKGVLTVTVRGADRELTVTSDTLLKDDEGDIADRLKDPRFKAGASVAFKVVEQDGKSILWGLKLGGVGQPSPGGRRGDIQSGKLKSLDLAKKSLVITVGGQDCTFTVTEDTKVLDAPDKGFPERFQILKPGAELLFKAVVRDGVDTLIGLKLAGAQVPFQPHVDTSKLKPLSELGAEKYQGFQGGFYSGGKNERPRQHEAAGLRLAQQVQPVDAAGKPNAEGKIVLLSVGMSNTSQASAGFQNALRSTRQKSPHLVFVNGAVGGMTARAIQDPDDHTSGTRYWKTVDQRLKEAGVTRDQVQAIWIKEADAGPREGFPGYAKTLQAELRRIVQILPARFPNLKLVYLSSRTYGGYAKTPLNPEPYAYESGFAVRWLIEKQIQGDKDLNYDRARGAVKAPWLSWGPYLWANGSKPRTDGFSYAVEDFGGDGTHLSPSGVQKVGNLMLRFFQTDSTTRPWFGQRGQGEDDESRKR
jgi:hypothetical protein